MKASDSLKKVARTLSILQEKVELSEKEKYFISEHQKDILFKNVHYEVKQELKTLFGKVSAKENYGLFQDVFASEKPGLNSGVMFSYWSFHGVPYSSSKEEDGVWRDNFFYKGLRYSDENSKANFYVPFNAISDYCKSENDNKSNVPVDFFVRHARKAKELGSKAVISPITFIPRIYKPTISNAICIPDKNSFAKENCFKDELKTLIEGLYVQKAEKDKCNTTAQRTTVKNAVEELLKVNLVKAFKKVKEAKNSIIHKFCDELHSKFSHLNSKDLFDVFCLIVCYQFYDHDGITYLYMPDELDKSHCCLGVLIPFENERKIARREKTFVKIIKTLSRLPILEKKVFENVKNNIILKDIWKAHHLSRAPLYESLCLHFYILLKHICRENKIEVLDITSRVKEFDSFYNRVVDRFNEPSKFKIKDADVQTYRKHFLSGTTDSIDFIYSKFWDIAGIRVLCVFKNDMEIINKELCEDNKLNKLKDLEKPYINKKYHIKVNFFDKKTANDYRAEHYILNLGDERGKLPELEKLKNLLCELQVKTTLSQGWSDADHDLFYKSELPPSQLEKLLPEKNPRIGKPRALASRKLDEIDDEFIRFRKTIKEILDDI